jgi:hypothetical protein
MINRQNYLMCTILQLRYEQKTLQTKQNQTHNLFLIDGQNIVCSTVPWITQTQKKCMLRCHKIDTWLNYALSLVDNGLIALSWCEGLQNEKTTRWRTSLFVLARSKATTRLFCRRTRDSVSWWGTLRLVQLVSPRDQNVLEHSPAQSK